MTKSEFNKIWELYKLRFGEVDRQKPERTNARYNEWWEAFQEQDPGILTRATKLLLREAKDDWFPVQADVWCYYDRVRHDDRFRSSEGPMSDEQKRLSEQIERIDHEIFILEPHEKAALQEEANAIAYGEFKEIEPNHRPFRHLNFFQVAHIGQLVLPVLARHRTQYWMRRLFAERNDLQFGNLRADKTPF